MAIVKMIQILKALVLWIRTAMRIPMLRNQMSKTLMWWIQMWWHPMSSPSQAKTALRSTSKQHQPKTVRPLMLTGPNWAM